MSAKPKRDPLGYEFSPVPRAATRALMDGRLDYGRYAILGALYDRDVPRNLHVQFTIDQLREWTGWTLSDDYLSSRLRDLKADGWLTYDSPSRTASPHGPVYRYAATLTPNPSEQCPSCNPSGAAIDYATGEVISPSSAPPGPTNGASESGAAMRQSANGPATSVRAGQRVQSNPSPRQRNELTHADAGEESELDRLWRETRPGRGAYSEDG